MLSMALKALALTVEQVLEEANDGTGFVRMNRKSFENLAAILRDLAGDARHQEETSLIAEIEAAQAATAGQPGANAATGCTILRLDDYRKGQARPAGGGAA